MGKFKDLTGEKFGRLTAIERDPENRLNWLCSCSCGSGKITSVMTGRLKCGNVKSCGCLSKELRLEMNQRKVKDLTGVRFGKLVVVNRAENNTSGVCWNCKCDCGGNKIADARNLSSGHIQSCGCLCRDSHIVHGLHGTRIYELWMRIKAKCYRETHEQYKDYGGRGIRMFDAWIDDPKSFADYVNSLPGYNEENCTLDRINNGNYEPGNLRWASQSQQARNKRTNTVTKELVLEIRELYKTMTQADIMRKFNLTRENVYSIVNYRTWKNI